jgi:hypothetical protein
VKILKGSKSDKLIVTITTGGEIGAEIVFVRVGVGVGVDVRVGVSVNVGEGVNDIVLVAV